MKRINLELFEMYIVTLGSCCFDVEIRVNIFSEQVVAYALKVMMDKYFFNDGAGRDSKLKSDECPCSG